jgi:2-(1,2-epoxy-1,2-dihydrophenyl)acetyl-CoA isomerase
MSTFSQPFEHENFDVTREDDVVTIRMDSTSGMNGINTEFVDELESIGIALRQDESVRCVTLTGSGGAFSVGADLAGFEGTAADGDLLRYLASTLHEGIEALLRMDAPLVTAVNGVAAGAGFSLALLGDVVLVSDEARLEFAYPRVGLTGDGGSTFFLPRLVGLRKAREIVLLDEPIAPAEAVDLDLATEVVPADDLGERRREVASDLAAGPTRAYAATRQLLLDSFDRGLESQLAAETDAIVGATETGDYQRGYEAFFADEPAEFEGE